MRNAGILSQLGLFVRRGFLGPEECLRIRREMLAASRTRAPVRPVGKPAGDVYDDARRTDTADVSATTVGLVGSRLLALKPELEAHFQVPLAGCEGPHFYLYEEGHFFRPHQDSDTDPVAPGYIKARRVSVSVFLNDEGGGLDGDAYRGGALVFYGRRPDPGADAAKLFGLPLASEEGMFVAFRSGWFHEVRPVTRGRRYSIVTWFY